MTDLVLDGVSYDTAGRTILHPVEITLPAGQVTAISGPSGSGKTTLLSIAAGLVRPMTGQARLGELAMWRGSGDPRPEVGLVLQVYGLVPVLTALENVSIAMRARGSAPAEADAAALAALERFHIAELAARQVEELSGGQMQRVACARGFVARPAVLLADEPTSELDEGNRENVLRQLRAEAERGAVVVVATHDPAVVEAADRHVTVDEGRVVDHVAAVDLHPTSFAPPRHRGPSEEAAGSSDPFGGPGADGRR